MAQALSIDAGLCPHVAQRSPHPFALRLCRTGDPPSIARRTPILAEGQWFRMLKSPSGEFANFLHNSHR